MCSLLVYKEKGNNYFLQKRGQDRTSYFEKNGLKFIHNLLSITGKFTPQPFAEDEIVCLYNGEIYGRKFIKSDGENLIPLYKEYGIKFPRHLDGEFAIALYDFKNDLALFITDPFASKPLWVKGIECASYESGVGGKKIPANTCLGKKISTEEELFEFEYHKWDWTQWKTGYDDCLKALKTAIEKRYQPRCFIGLSSGYDSGTIASVLLGRNLKCYSIIASENKSIINQRANLLDVEVVEDFDIKKEKEHLKDAEEFIYKTGESYKEDYASWGLSHICRMANKENRKIYLSGMGADEIISDYSLIPTQSQFKGKFPDRLYKWENFNDGKMFDYLGKEECVAGSWNIETRYPFLDKAFVQEYLWLAPELKNRRYKSVLAEYLDQNQFPYEPNKKIGFCLL